MAKRRQMRPFRTGGPNVLMVTEGTYPYVVGGVSSWCDLLIRGLPDIRWSVLPLVGADRPTAPLFTLPANAELLPRLELWSDTLPPWRWRGFGRGDVDVTLPARLARSLLSWRGDYDQLVAVLVRCRREADGIVHAFRVKESWHRYLECLEQLVAEEGEEFRSVPSFSAADAVRLYQTLYWVARTAAAPTPPCDVLHVTAAGWAAVPAIVDRALKGTPVLLTEHGVYVREAYLATVRNREPAGSRFIATRLARGLARAAYAAADAVAPVTQANARWERALGVDQEKIYVIVNGVASSRPPVPPPANSMTVVSVGRIDPLKDVHTMLRVAREVGRRMPKARFLHYGPVSEGQEAYGRSCHLLHERLALGPQFRFMGSTRDPLGVVRDANIVLMTSISEGLPLSILEAMTQARPVVATGVGGVPEVVRGCGIVTPPGDVQGLADAVVTLLRNPLLAARLGETAYRKVMSEYAEADCLSGYDELLRAVAGGQVAA